MGGSGVVGAEGEEEGAVVGGWVRRGTEEGEEEESNGAAEDGENCGEEASAAVWFGRRRRGEEEGGGVEAGHGGNSGRWLRERTRRQCGRTRWACKFEVGSGVLCFVLFPQDSRFLFVAIATHCACATSEPVAAGAMVLHLLHFFLWSFESAGPPGLTILLFLLLLPKGMGYS